MVVVVVAATVVARAHVCYKSLAFVQRRTQKVLELPSVVGGRRFPEAASRSDTDDELLVAKPHTTRCRGPSTSILGDSVAQEAHFSLQTSALSCGLRPVAPVAGERFQARQTPRRDPRYAK
jgi:hypothetical protein